MTCADVMYSGHTVNITLCAMTWHTYSHVVPLTKFDPICALRFGRSVTDMDLPPVRNEMGEALRWTSLKIVIWTVASVGYVLIIATHFHYTLDVSSEQYLPLWYSNSISLRSYRTSSRQQPE